jgi:HEAT repeat protein
VSKEVAGRRTGRLGQSQAPPLADWLVALSHDSPFEGPQAPARPAGASPPLSAVPSLLSLLQDDDRTVRLRAVAALGEFAAEVRRALPALRAALEEAALGDEDAGVRTEAGRGLLRAGPQPAAEVPALTDALHSAIDVVRFHAAITLGDFGRDGRPAVPDLIRASLWDGESAVRLAAATALRKIGRNGPLVLSVLTEALGDANELVCWVAAERLGQMGPEAREAVPALRQALRRDYRLSIVKTGVRLALERIDPQAAAAAG